MFEFHKQGKAFRNSSRPASRYKAFEGGRRRTLLVWGEHCTECAMPDCYASCDLYEPRPDSRCRRFEFGIYRNSAFPSANGYGAEVVFKRWGKLEARGNATLMPASVVRSSEAALGALRWAADASGAMIAKVTRRPKWSYAGYALLERLNGLLRRSGDPTDIPDAFVAEIYNPGAGPVTLLLSMAADRASLGKAVAPDQLPTPVLKKLEIGPGYFRMDLPSSAFRSLLEADLPFNLALMPDALEGTRLVFLTLEFVSYRASKGAPAAATGPSAAAPACKCVVFDLDNTLWDGILLENEVRLRESIAETIRQLDERGILMSVASKNAREDALAQLAKFGIDEYFLGPEIGWAPKSESIAAIARSLDIGLDSLIFVDDNRFERDEVARALPQVEVLPDSALPDLLDHPRLRGNVTAESRTRRSMYQQAMVRQSASASYGDNYIEFLRSCEIEVEIRPDRSEDRERISELVQRTNQLNFSGRKYSRAEVDQILESGSGERYVVSCSDRYGSYGIVGFCLAHVDGDSVTIEDLMLSCRVQGKSLERALFHHLCTRPGWAARSLAVNFISTDRNAAARAVLSALGFVAARDGMLLLDPVPAELAPDFIKIEGGYASSEQSSNRLWVPTNPSRRADQVG